MFSTLIFHHTPALHAELLGFLCTIREASHEVHDDQCGTAADTRSAVHEDSCVGVRAIHECEYEELRSSVLVSLQILEHMRRIVSSDLLKCVLGAFSGHGTTGCTLTLVLRTRLLDELKGLVEVGRDVCGVHVLCVQPDQPQNSRDLHASWKQVGNGL